MHPVDVVFRNMLRSDAVEARIREKIEALSAFDPRLQHCRVIVDLPHRHRKHGDRFRVRIELKVPRGKDLIVDHGPVADVHQAVHDAFEAAARRLKTDAERRRGAVKSHASRDRDTDFGVADAWH